MYKFLRFFVVFAICIGLFAASVSAVDSTIVSGGRVTPYMGGAYFIASSNNTVRGIESLPSRYGTDENGMRFLFFGKLYDVIQPGVYKVEIDISDEYWGSVSEGIVDWQQNAGFGLYIADPYLWNDLPTALFQYRTCPESFMSFTADGRALQTRPGCYLKSYVSHGVGSDGDLHYTLLFTVTDDTITYPESLYKYLCFGFDDYSNLSVQITSWDELPLSGLDPKQGFDEIVSAIDHLAATMGGGLTEQQVEQAVSRALEEQSRRDESRLQSGIDDAVSQTQTLLSPYRDSISAFGTALGSIVSAISSPGSAALITLPAGTVLGHTIWQPQSVDLIAWYDQLMPPILRQAVSVVLAYMVARALILEVAYSIKRALGLGGDKHD